MASALVLAIAVGLLAGIGLAVNRLLEEPWASSASLLAAHKAAQMWGFVGLFIIGMSLRMLPLWTQAPLQLSRLVPVLWVTISAAVLLTAFVVPSLPAELESASEAAVAVALLVASLIFLAIIASTLRARAVSARRPPWAFLAGAVLLFLAAGLRLAMVVSDGYNLWVRSAESLVFLGGFMPAFVTSAAARGFRSGRWGEGWFAVAFTGATVFLAALLVYLNAGQSDASVRLTGLVFLVSATLWASVAYLSGVFNPAASRPGTSSWPHLALVRSAFLWTVVSALIAFWMGGRSLLAADLPSSANLDAIVHGLGMSALILILGMGLLLLPEFARTPLRSRSSTLLALGLLGALNLAAGLRVASALARDAVDADWLAGAQALAGILSEAALVAFVVALARAVLRGKRLPQRAEPTS